MLASINFYPSPDSPASSTTIHYSGHSGWAPLRECLASDLGCHPDDLEFEDVYFGDETADVITLRGEIIGSIERPLTVADLMEINGETKGPVALAAAEGTAP